MTRAPTTRFEENQRLLAPLLGIEKLPDFVKKSRFRLPLIKELENDAGYRRSFVRMVRKHLPDATPQEVITVLKLYELGMQYTQHSTGKTPYNEFLLGQELTTADGIALNRFCYAPELGKQYLLPIEALADGVERLRTGTRKCYSNLHAPAMRVSGPQILVMVGAEESHHVVTYKQDPAFHFQQSIDTQHRGTEQYFVRKLETEFGKEINKLVTCFGFDVEQGSIKQIIKQSGIEGERFSELYRARLEERYGFTFPDDSGKKR